MQDDPFARAVERVQVAEQAEQESKRKRRKKQFASGNRTGFRIHATVYVAVNVLLIAIWASAWQLNGASSYPWFIWVLLGWGIGLAAHYAAVRDHLTRRAEQPSPVITQPDDGTAPSTPSTAKDLIDLAELHRSGALSDDEFQTAKAKLLE